MGCKPYEIVRETDTTMRAKRVMSANLHEPKMRGIGIMSVH